jgi:hypothetical protein
MVALGSDLQPVVEAGMSLVVGTVSADGEPRAHRAWWATIVDPDVPRLRFVMSNDDTDLAARLANGAVSLTGANVATYESRQVKGRVATVEPPTVHDLERTRHSIDAFFDAIHRTDGNPLEHLARMLPEHYVAVEMTVEEVYDQTPGPKAGAAWLA